MKAGYGLFYATIAISMFLDGIDGTIVNVALPEIAESFGIGASGASWVTTVYFLVMSGLILVFGRMCDMGAIKRILIAGMAVFTLGSFFCGVAPSMTILLVSRALQGIGAAMLASSAVMLGVKYLPKEKIGLGMSLVVMGTSLGVAIGPTAGAMITQFIGWHWVFFINVPIGVLAMILAHKAVPRDSGFEKSDLDLPGSAMLFVSIILGLYVVERIPSEGMSAIGVLAAIGCLVLFSLFLRYEKGRDNPVLNVGLFRNRGFNLATGAYVIVNMAIMGVIYLIPFFMRGVLGLDFVECGMLLSLQSVSMVICCLTVGRLSERYGNRGFAIIACLVMLIFMITAYFYGLDTSMLYLACSLLVCGTIWGIGGGPMGSRMVNVLPDKDRGSGSSMISFVMYFSSALGTALFAGLFGLGSGQGSISISDVPPDLFMDGFQFSVVIGLVLSIIGVVLAYSLKGDSPE